MDADGRNIMNPGITKIANRHIARCLSKIEEVHKLPEICKARIRSEMHHTAEDVAREVAKALVGASPDEGGVLVLDEAFENRGNR